MKTPCQILPIRLLAAIFLAVSLLTLSACSRNASSASAAMNNAENAETTEASTTSDLDEPVEALLGAVCEHKISQYTCDECRYEVGFVKVDETLFDRQKGGELTTVTAEVRDLPTTVELVGDVRLDQSRSTSIGPPVGGVVRKVRVDVGQHVKSGQALIEIDSADYRMARGELKRALAAERLANTGLERERALAAKRISSQRDLLEAEALLRQAQADTQVCSGRLATFGLTPQEIAQLGEENSTTNELLFIRAPYGATILTIQTSPGSRVQPGDTLCVIGDTSTVWVMAIIPESELHYLQDPSVRQNATVQITVVGFPNQVFPGSIEQISPTIDPATRSGSVRIVVKNPQGLLRPGMFANVRVAIPSTNKNLVVPQDAILEDEGRSFVFVHAQGPYYVRRPVTPGKNGEGLTAVIGDIKAGDMIVNRGAFLLKSDVLRAKMGAGCAD